MRLNDKGQCPVCQRKPRIYKRYGFYACIRCGRHYSLETGEELEEAEAQKRACVELFLSVVL